MHTITVGPYILAVGTEEPPSLYAEYKEQARLVEELDLDHTDRDFCYLVVGRSLDHPDLVLAQRYDPPAIGGFHPGALIAPETDVLFVGAGTRALAYDLVRPARLWEDTADVGFWRWARHGHTIVMSAELELAAWNIDGTKLWSTFVEPPWSYEVADDVVHLDVMGVMSDFSLKCGPEKNP